MNKNDEVILPRLSNGNGNTRLPEIVEVYPSKCVCVCVRRSSMFVSRETKVTGSVSLFSHLVIMQDTNPGCFLRHALRVPRQRTRCISLPSRYAADEPTGAVFLLEVSTDRRRIFPKLHFSISPIFIVLCCVWKLAYLFILEATASILLEFIKVTALQSYS